MFEEEYVGLKFEGAVDVARWTCKAWESGHFDWNLLAGGSEEENVAERWRVIRWLNDECCLDCLHIADSDDREMSAAIMFFFFLSSLRERAGQEGITPQEWLDFDLSNAEALNALDAA
jgi:hypothetical protein